MRVDCMLIFFLFLHENICCGYSLEVPHWYKRLWCTTESYSPRQSTFFFNQNKLICSSNENYNTCICGEIRKIFILVFISSGANYRHHISIHKYMYSDWPYDLLKTCKDHCLSTCTVNSPYLKVQGTNRKTSLFICIKNFTSNENFQIKKPWIFYISAQNINCGYLLEPPQQGSSNEHPQSMFSSRNKKNNVYPCKPHFFYIKVGFKGMKII